MTSGYSTINMTTNVSAYGTTGYIAPERSQQSFDCIASDIYRYICKDTIYSSYLLMRHNYTISVGVLFCEILCGQSTSKDHNLVDEVEDICFEARKK